MKTTLLTNPKTRQSKANPRTDVQLLINACAAAVSRHQKLADSRAAKESDPAEIDRVNQLQSGLRAFEHSTSWVQKLNIVEELYSELIRSRTELRRSAVTLLAQPLYSEHDVAIDDSEGDLDWLQDATESGHKLLVCALLAHRKSPDGFAPELSPRLYLRVVEEHNLTHASSKAQFLRNGLRTIRKHRALSSEQAEIVGSALLSPQMALDDSVLKASRALQDLAMDSSF